MSAFDTSIDRTNKPNGKSTQTFYFKTHYEAKHAIGKQHIKRLEFQSRIGIRSVESLCDKHYSKIERPLHYGRFIISGIPNAVDNLMIEIREWLDSCENMYVGRNNFATQIRTANLIEKIKNMTFD